MIPIILIGCGGGTDPDIVTTTSVATTSIPPTAEIILEIGDYGGGETDQGNMFYVEFTLTETAGVGANINFARLEVFRATGELVERREIGASAIIEGVGDNRLEALTSEEAWVWFRFNATIKRGRKLLLTLGFTDDFGHDIEIDEDWYFTK
jgi:hypothetical protein